jgi:hypothetical protein
MKSSLLSLLQLPVCNEMRLLSAHEIGTGVKIKPSANSMLAFLIETDILNFY